LTRIAARCENVWSFCGKLYGEKSIQRMDKATPTVGPVSRFHPAGALLDDIYWTNLFFNNQSPIALYIGDPFAMVIRVILRGNPFGERDRFWCHVWYKNFGIQNNQKPLSMG
jgi:hypothetical protein